MTRNNQPVLPLHQCRILRILRSEGPLSRWQLHQRAKLRPNTVGTHVAELLEKGVLREQAAEARGPGRPRVPVAIDNTSLHVVGAAIRPGHVEACRLNLCSQALGRLHSQPVPTPSDTVSVVKDLLGRLTNDQTFLVGLSTTGFVDTTARQILLSSALPGEHVASLDSLLEVSGRRPLAVENDMHALAARWLQEHHRQPTEDVVLVYLDDGQLGSALLVRGEPNWGCLVGGNELGHTTLPVETDRCYCGNVGCMERICSSEFLRQKGAPPTPLLDHVTRFDGTQPEMKRMIELLSIGLANCVNFVRPHRVVLVSPFTRFSPFTETLMGAVRSRLMRALSDRVDFHYWDQGASAPGEAAGWLALAAVYYPNWTKAILHHPETS
jgi:predicted NBD/HSP70 family sugar kinase